MCTCGRPSPVFLQAPGSESPFLEQVFGRSLADDIRSLFGQRIYESPYGWLCSCGSDSYLAAAFSSVWLLLVFLLAFAAGLMFRSKRRAAIWTLVAGAAISLIDFATRFHDRYSIGRSELREVMMNGLPGQIFANLVFQFLLPFALALLLTFLIAGLRRSLFRLFARSRSAA